MSFNISKLNKLKGRSAHELAVRTQQEMCKLLERHLGYRTTAMTDNALLQEFDSITRIAGGSKRVLKRLNETHSHVLPALVDIQNVISIMKSQFLDECAAIIVRADKARNGNFDLLGLRDLNFGSPIDWHLEPVSGKRTPMVHWSDLDYLDPLDGGDQKILWELNRHAHFVTLGQAYRLTKDESYAKAFVDQAMSWMDSNAPAMGVNWASSLEVSFRAISWLWALQLCADSKNIDENFINRFIKFIVAHGRHIELYLSHYYSPNTHLTGEALGLFYIGVLLPELKRSHGWRELGMKILIEQLSKQVRADGVYFEQSSYYHRYTADFYIHYKMLSGICKITLPSIVDSKLKSLLDHLMWITRPDGSSPFYGDDDGGRLISFISRRANDFRDTLALGALMFSRSDWKHVAAFNRIDNRNHYPELLWLLGSQGLRDFNDLASSPPSEKSKAFDASGYIVARDGWDRNSSYVLFDAGPHGGLPKCGHSHADALSIEYVCNGQRWFIDPGTFVYDCNDEARDLFRGTDGHNTVTVDGVSQSRPDGAFAWSHIACSNILRFEELSTGVSMTGEHDGYRNLPDPVHHTRSLSFAPPQLLICDELKTEGLHEYAINFHFPPEVTVIIDNNKVVARNSAGNAISISVSGTSQVKAHLKTGWVSECYGYRRKAQVAVFKATGVGNQKFDTQVSEL